MGNCNEPHKPTPCGPPKPGFCGSGRGHSFIWRGPWKACSYYYNDEFVTDFVSYKNTILACRHNHMSDINAEPELIYDGDKPINVAPPNWSFVLYAGGSTDLSDLVFRLDGNVLSYSIDGGSTFIEIGNVGADEQDPIFKSSVAYNITSEDINNWNNKTSNPGTVTAVKMNNNTISPNQNGIVDLGSVIVSETQADWDASSGSAYIRNKPTIPDAITESTVSGWGFTKNNGTLTGVTFNGVDASINNGIASITAEVPVSAGILNTNNSTGQTANASEPLTGTVKLHKVSKTGSYNDLLNKPTIPSEVTETTVSGWGFTKNAGTVTAVKINNQTHNPSSGVVDLGSVGGVGALNDLSDVTLSSPAYGNQLVYDGSKWVNGSAGNMNYMKVTSAQYASMQQGGTLQSNVLYIIVD